MVFAVAVVPIIPTDGEIGEVVVEEKDGESESESGGLLSAPPTPPVMPPAVSSYYKQFDDEPDPPGVVLKVLMYVGKVTEVVAHNGKERGSRREN